MTISVGDKLPGSQVGDDGGRSAGQNHRRYFQGQEGTLSRVPASLNRHLHTCTCPAFSSTLRIKDKGVMSTIAIPFSVNRPLAHERLESGDTDQRDEAVFLADGKRLTKGRSGMEPTLGKVSHPLTTATR